jgi:hypothetical protein
LNKDIKWWIGSTYLLIHSLFIVFCAFILLFSNSVIHLTILLLIVSLDAFSIVVLHECPLTILEKKYMGINCSEMRQKDLKNAGIHYRCNHTYEKQIELMINVWLLVAFKICCILFSQTCFAKKIT